MISAAAARTDTVTVQNVNSAGRPENLMVPAFVLMNPSLPSGTSSGTDL